MQHILIITDNQGTRAIELHEASSSIGRDPENSIILCSCEVSRQHAILLRMMHPGQQEYKFCITDGNLQGKPSTNGLYVNGRRIQSHVLRSGDKVVFSTDASVRYFSTKKKTDAEWLLSGSEEALHYMSTLATTPVRAFNNADVEKLDYSVLSRLASFPELFIHPIVEVSTSGEITYRNPAAIQQFPNLLEEKMNHPILAGIVEAVTSSGEPQLIREIRIEDCIFEQSLSYIPQSDLIRSYLVDITDRKHAENELKALHDKLAADVEKRTLQFNEANNRLKQEEKALVASYATNRALLNAIPDPMFRIDRAGNFVNFKSPKKHTLPFKPNTCIDCHLSDILPDRAAQDIQQCITKALETETVQIIELQLPTAAETFLCFEARIAVSDAHEVMVIMRDITERTKREAEIRTALEKERELNEMKTRFVSIASHEFRTPLTTILSSAELIEHYGDRCTLEKQLKFLHKIQNATKHMTSLLDDVLLISRVESGKVAFKPLPIDLEMFCQDIMEELQITTDSHQLVMRSQQVEAPISIDQKLVRHILTNLLSNAINYSPQGGEILVMLNKRDDEIEIQVQDYGIGIPEESQATLFDSFVRGSNVGTISGTGLGLAIVKKSVDLHQGEISCYSKVGEGTTFIVRLPTNTDVTTSEPLPKHPLEQASNSAVVESAASEKSCKDTASVATAG